MRPADAGLSPLLARAMSALDAGVCITDGGGHIVWVNEAFCAMCGYTPAELLGQTPAMLKSGRQDSALYSQIWHTIRSGRPWRGVLINRHKDGTLYTVEERIAPMLDDKGAISHFIALVEDIAPRSADQERQQFLAFHDSLTGLINRPMLMETLAQSIVWSAHDHALMALLFLDLDKFKPVNDKYGHGMGDQLLMAVAGRLRAAVRKSDVVARLGGDEFAIIENELSDPAQAGHLASKLVESIQQPFNLERRRIRIGASIGIAVYPADGEDATTLLAHADEAMYRAKQAGRNGWCYYAQTAAA